MAVNTKLSPLKVVEKEFSAKKYGYDALEVDKYLDLIVDDYYSMLNYIETLEKENESLKKSLTLYKDRLDATELKNAVMDEKLSHIANNDAASLSNLDILKRISVLEQALFKLGVDPTTIK